MHPHPAPDSTAARPSFGCATTALAGRAGGGCGGAPGGERTTCSGRFASSRGGRPHRRGRRGATRAALVARRCLRRCGRPLRRGVGDARGGRPLRRG
eukprot:467766-Prymnesium_polylepis.1